MKKSVVLYFNKKLLLYVALLFMLIKVSFSYSAILPYSELLDDILSYSSAFLLAVYTVLCNDRVRFLIIYAVFGGLCCYSALISDQFNLFITVLVIFAIHKEDFNQIIWFIFLFELIFLLLMILLSLLMASLNKYQLFVDYGGRVRCSFGFGHPNTFSIYLFNIILMWIWLWYDRIQWKHYIGLFIICLIAYLFSDTRTSFALTIVSLVLLYFSKRHNKTRWLRSLAITIAPLLTLLFVCSVNLYTTNSSIILWLDQLLNTRLKLGSYAYYHHGFSFFGQNVFRYDIAVDPYWNLSSFTFDCAYTYFMMCGGWLWLIMACVLFAVLAVKGNNKIRLFIIIWCLYAITEVHGMNCFLSFPILMITFALQKTRSVTVARPVKNIAQ